MGFDFAAFITGVIMGAVGVGAVWWDGARSESDGATSKSESLPPMDGHTIVTRNGKQFYRKMPARNG